MAASSNTPVHVGDPLVALHLPSYVDDRAPGSYFPNPRADGPSAFMTWAYVIRVLSHGDLDQLFRDPVCDTAYRAFAPSVRAQYDGLENYIRTVRLGWPAEQHTGPAAPNMLDRPAKDPLSILGAAAAAAGGASGVSTPNGTRLPVEAVRETWPEKVLPHPLRPGIVLRHFVEDADRAGEAGESLVKTIPNDWPYGIPAGSTHWVVWSKLPILHPSLFSTPDTPFDESMREELYSCVTGDGIRGFTGFVPADHPTYVSWSGADKPRVVEILGSYSQAKLAAQDADAQAPKHVLTKERISQAHAWASRHVTRYIEAQWPSDRFVTAWFCNPPALRTVPGLSHFHVIVRERAATPDLQSS
ncbi:hypothetical protein EX895_001478 [Sporisorium graminicola]|uniref:Uncharacterized protein n=1 Tax=Sporisorium graminicola TaxID=280036 RepID=A0A4U7KY92_9BASI|nr:hypothetical protein EX895_001478 [Sporisorium graminicola]TKY89693.1 hypothetical protein EX895_001478 [Sporisorium graminicola]